MPRAARYAPGGMVFHVLNRGNQRQRIFHKRGDARAFLSLLHEAKQPDKGAPVRLLAYCLMPNHWHLVLWPREDAHLSAYMEWLTNAHVRRYRTHSNTEGHGHLYQGRFKSFPVQASAGEIHLLRVIRYVEANPDRAEQWSWSSLSNPGPLIDDWPVDRPSNWLDLVNQPMSDDELAELRTCTQRGRPYGDPTWVTQTADRLGLQSTLRNVGRPKGTAAISPPRPLDD